MSQISEKLAETTIGTIATAYLKWRTEDEPGQALSLLEVGIDNFVLLKIKILIVVFQPILLTVQETDFVANLLLSDIYAKLRDFNESLGYAQKAKSLLETFSQNTGELLDRYC
jgi:hypothetical protein